MAKAGLQNLSISNLAGNYRQQARVLIICDFGLLDSDPNFFELLYFCYFGLILESPYKVLLNLCYFGLILETPYKLRYLIRF
jgi:hypothetical protein